MAKEKDIKPQKKYCCKSLTQHLNQSCSKHGDDCVDKTILHYKDSKEFGMPIRDGGSSFYKISFCPFCGSNLKKFA